MTGIRRDVATAMLLAVSLAGCGLREPLQPAAGQSMPRAPALADRALTPDELLSVSSEMRPLRVDEPLTRSERRPVDPFDLPPPNAGEPAAPVPALSNTAVPANPAPSSSPQ